MSHRSPEVTRTVAGAGLFISELLYPKVKTVAGSDGNHRSWRSESRGGGVLVTRAILPSISQ